MGFERARVLFDLRPALFFHSGPADNPYCFLNVLLRGTYIRPHRHLVPPKSESFLVLEGLADVILFDNQGAIFPRTCGTRS